MLIRCRSSSRRRVSSFCHFCTKAKEVLRPIDTKKKQHLKYISWQPPFPVWIEGFAWVEYFVHFFGVKCELLEVDNQSIEKDCTKNYYQKIEVVFFPGRRILGTIKEALV